MTLFFLFLVSSSLKLLFGAANKVRRFKKNIQCQRSVRPTACNRRLNFKRVCFRPIMISDVVIDGGMRCLLVNHSFRCCREKKQTKIDEGFVKMSKTVLKSKISNQHPIVTYIHIATCLPCERLPHYALLKPLPMIRTPPRYAWKARVQQHNNAGSRDQRRWRAMRARKTSGTHANKRLTTLVDSNKEEREV